MILALSIFVSLLLLWWICAPLFRQGELEIAQDRELAQERMLSLLKALKALEVDKTRMTEEDVRNIETRLMLELARLYYQMGVVPDEAASATLESGSAETPPPSYCAGCGKIRRAHHCFCPTCGFGFHAA